MFRRACTKLTPSLPQSVNFQSWKVYIQTCKANIFHTCNNPAFNTAHFDVNMSTCWRQRSNRISFFAFSPSMSCTCLHSCGGVKGRINLFSFSFFLTDLTFVKFAFLALLACQVIVIVGDFDLCCCLPCYTYDVSPARYLSLLILWNKQSHCAGWPFLETALLSQVQKELKSRHLSSYHSTWNLNFPSIGGGGGAEWVDIQISR